MDMRQWARPKRPRHLLTQARGVANLGKQADMTERTRSLPIAGAAARPERRVEVQPHYSAGRYLLPEVYVVGWPHDLIKLGHTGLGRRRYSRYLSSGATVVTRAYYDLRDIVTAEKWLESWVATRYQRAFTSRDECRDSLSLPTGDGWTEFYEVPRHDWPLLDIALGVGV